MLDVSTYQRESCATDLAVEDWDNKKSNPPSLILATTEFGLGRASGVVYKELWPHKEIWGLGILTEY